MGGDPRKRAAERDAMRRQGREPAPLQDDDILTAMDIAEIHEVAQRFRGMRVDLPVTLSLSRYEMVCSRSEYVAMAETLLQLSCMCDELLVELALARRHAGKEAT